ncbi:related to F-box protein pof7 [Melanopsichium pennsylvanicum]|uniref:Related to F-box protein pof7 n=2 Tax=Melanopsichium pennsylvanicum TaxID=63383 RepID=A0AAJ4XRE8_9BASI|nr:related to F-box protein pof7 [Melanopsichium pennsylvanicum]
MEHDNTAPSIQPHTEHMAALDDDVVQHDSEPSTLFAAQSGAQPPLESSTETGTSQREIPVDDELERFRSEWRKEVKARGHATYAQPSAVHTSATGTASNSGNSAQVKRATVPQASWSRAPQQTQVESDTSTEINGLQGEDHENEIDDQQNVSLHADTTSLPFPETEIYAPAALKYSKGAHKVSRAAAKQLKSQNDPSAPSLPSEYYPPPPSSEQIDGEPSSSVSSIANGVLHSHRDRIRASAARSSFSTSPSRPLTPKQPILTDSEASGSSSNSSQARAPRVMATPNAPALASEMTQVGMRSAVETYAHAVEMERSGQLDKALASYRRAFKLNSNADRLYHRAHLLLTDPALANTSTQQNDALLTSPAIADKVRKALDFDDHRYVAIKERQAKEAEAQARGEVYDRAEAEITALTWTQTGEKSSKLAESRPDELAKLLENLSIEGGGERDFGMVAFEPEDEEKQIPITRLPDEILLNILRMVIAPRGRRGAKVLKPKPTPEEQAAMEAATAALTGRSITASSAQIETQKVTKPSATATTNGKAENTSMAASAGRDAAIAPAETTTSTSKSLEKEKASDNPVAIAATRKQPLGIGIVLGGADWQSLEILGRTCWKFRLLTKSPSLWREIVHETYYPPILDPSLTTSTLYERHHSDWRTAFINQPRVRLNGCYIAACHYARPGLSEDAWVRVIHVVEFYRSIRFLPDGTALSLLTTDTPNETVRKLEPGLKAKGFSKGRWELFEQGLEDDEEEGRPRGPKVVLEDLRDKSMQKYAFRMVFGLRSTTRGRWNKLDLLEYYSVNLINGEVLPLPQKHSRPFHFSRVLAYGV